MWHHDSSATMMAFWSSAEEFKSVILEKKFKSSANIRILHSGRNSTMSFMNKLKSRGPIWLPCGTPEETIISLERFVPELNLLSSVR